MNMNIELPANIAADAADGQEVEITVKGKVSVGEDGSRNLQISEVDGQPVESGADTSEMESKMGEALRKREDIQNAGDMGGGY